MAIRPERVRVFAPAKINLCLHVVGRRPDGFHELQSLVVFADIGDMLDVARADAFSLEVDGPFAGGLAGEADNLVLRAARALGARLGIEGGARFRLTKNLPVASGIGGGSADAAAALRAVQALCGDIAPSELHDLAASLGSDIPVCVASTPAMMEGRGERLTALPPLPHAPIVLVNPGVSVATADVFRGLGRKDNPPVFPPPAFPSLNELADYLRATRNDLEEPAVRIAPAIREVLEALAKEGAVVARMSGSGATCFGLFESAQRAQAAAASIAAARRTWWSRAGALAGRDLARPVSHA